MLISDRALGLDRDDAAMIEVFIDAHCAITYILLNSGIYRLWPNLGPCVSTAVHVRTAWQHLPISFKSDRVLGCKNRVLGCKNNFAAVVLFLVENLIGSGGLSKGHTVTDDDIRV